MRLTWNNREVIVRPATADESSTVLALLDEAGTWLHTRGITDQWPKHFEPSWIDTSLRAGHTWLASVDDRAAGTITLNWQDRFWADLDQTASAGYVHRLAARRGLPGLGATLLDWAGEQTRRSGRELLRLDCATANQRLNAYYRAAGFTFRGEVAITGAPGMRELNGERFTLSRYERPA